MTNKAFTKQRKLERKAKAKAIKLDRKQARKDKALHTYRNWQAA